MLKLNIEEYFISQFYAMHLKAILQTDAGAKKCGKTIVFRKKKLHSDILKGSHHRIEDAISVLNTDGIFHSQLSLKNLHIRLDCAPLGHV